MFSRLAHNLLCYRSRNIFLTRNTQTFAEQRRRNSVYSAQFSVFRVEKQIDKKGTKSWQ